MSLSSVPEGGNEARRSPRAKHRHLGGGDARQPGDPRVGAHPPGVDADLFVIGPRRRWSWARRPPPCQGKLVFGPGPTAPGSKSRRG